MTVPRLLVLAFALTFATSSAAAAPSSDGPATNAVRKANKTISRLLAVKVEPGTAKETKVAGQVTQSVRGFLDVEELGRRALVDHWDGLAPAQRKEFLELLRSLVEANYIRGLRARVDYDVEYTGESKKGDAILVATEVKAKRRGRPVTISVDYSVRKDGGDFRVYDIVTDGVGLVENYRSQFNRIIGKEKFAGLLDRMRKQKAALEAKE